jgi:hypothetical protein
MFLVIVGQRRVCRRDVGNIGIKRRVLHEFPTPGLTISNALLHRPKGIKGCANMQRI